MFERYFDLTMGRNIDQPFKTHGEETSQPLSLQSLTGCKPTEVRYTLARMGDAMMSGDGHGGDFHAGDAILKWMSMAGLTRAQLAHKTGHRRNTITDLINNNVETEPSTLKNVLKALNKTPEELQALVNQMNGRGAAPLVRPSDRTRDYDRDPKTREWIEYGKRIAELPQDAQMAIFNVIRAFENLYRKET